MNAKSTRSTIVLASSTLVSVTAVLILAGGASATQLVPDQEPVSTTRSVAAWDGEANLAMRHDAMDVAWWSKRA